MSSLDNNISASPDTGSEWPSWIGPRVDLVHTPPSQQRQRQRPRTISTRSNSSVVSVRRKPVPLLPPDQAHSFESFKASLPRSATVPTSSPVTFSPIPPCPQRRLSRDSPRKVHHAVSLPNLVRRRSRSNPPSTPRKFGLPSLKRLLTFFPFSSSTTTHKSSSSPTVPSSSVLLISKPQLSPHLHIPPSPMTRHRDLGLHLESHSARNPIYPTFPSVATLTASQTSTADLHDHPVDETSYFNPVIRPVPSAPDVISSSDTPHRTGSALPSGNSECSRILIVNSFFDDSDSEYDDDLGGEHVQWCSAADILSDHLDPVDECRATQDQHNAVVSGSSTACRDPNAYAVSHYGGTRSIHNGGSAWNAAPSRLSWANDHDDQAPTRRAFELSR